MRKKVVDVTVLFVVFTLGCLVSRLAASAGADFRITTEVKVGSASVAFKCTQGCAWQEKAFHCPSGESSCLFRVSSTTVYPVNADSPRPN